VSLPAADDLFRSSGDPRPVRAVADHESAVPAAAPATATAASPAQAPGRRPSGRVRHDEKMTVYVTSDELLDIEHTRLALRRSHGLAVDRGRVVREAVAMVLADFETHGEDSALVRRLTEE
jgi:hypothetical protein